MRLTPEEVEVIYEFRGETLDNVNSNTALDLHLKERGINKKDVVSVKHWQNMSGELRFSIVTKENLEDNYKSFFDKIKLLIESNSPSYPAIVREDGEHSS